MTTPIQIQALRTAINGNEEEIASLIKKNDNLLFKILTQINIENFKNIKLDNLIKINVNF
jgi:hypothetical protein